MLAADTHITEWLQLIRAEYREIPGLRLTNPQAQRLWGRFHRPGWRGLWLVAKYSLHVWLTAPLSTGTAAMLSRDGVGWSTDRLTAFTTQKHPPVLERHEVVCARQLREKPGPWSRGW